MRVLVACEISGIVRDAFRDAGHDAWSCDLQSNANRWHIQGDARDVIRDGWDLMIAHPPCTYLSNSGVHWLHRRPGRWKLMREGAEFFRAMLDAEIPRKSVENPIIHKYALEIIGRRCDQIIQPHWFGDPESKATCLWLHRLPLLVPTNRLPMPDCGHWQNQCPGGQNKLPPSPDRAAIRSKTYPGIARAMAEQWGSARLIVQERLFN